MRIKQPDGSVVLTGEDAKTYTFNSNISDRVGELQAMFGITNLETDASLQDKVIRDMSVTCRTKIINEFYSECLGLKKRFDCDPIDQSRIIGYYFMAKGIISLDPTKLDKPDQNLKWKSSDDDACFAFSPSQVIKLGEDMQAHITDHTDRYNELKMWAKSKNPNDQVLNTWTWERKSEV